MNAPYSHYRRRRHPVVVHILLLLACGLLLLGFPTATNAFTTFKPSSLATTSSRKQHRHQQHVGVLYMSDTTSTTSSPSVPAARRVPTTSTPRPEQVDAAQVLNKQQQQKQQSNSNSYTTGLLIIGFITFLNASTNPLWHSVVGSTSGTPPPPLLLNAAVAVVAYVGLVAGGDLLEDDSNNDNNSKAMMMVDENVDTTTAMDESPPSLSLSSSIPNTLQSVWQTHRGGMELGFWKCLGTTSHIYGLSWTTANHGAFLIQLTTLIVPVVQSLQGEVLPTSIQGAVALALLGVYLFTQDPHGAASAAAATSSTTTTDLQLWGDALCVACAFFYSFYDLQTFQWGKQVPRKQLVTTKIGTQAFLSVVLCAAVSGSESLDYIQDFVSSSNNNHEPSMWVLPAIILWSGLVVNALATFLQVQGMQFIGPTRAQTIFASQPLWSALLSYAVLGETIGGQGMVGGGAFLAALALAIAAPQDDDNNKE